MPRPPGSGSGCGRALPAWLALLALSACATTHIVESWKDPSARGPMNFQKVVALVISPDATVQHVAEDELVRQIGPARAVAAYTLLDEQQRSTPDGVLAALAERGADALVTMRLVDATQVTTYVPGRIDPFPTYYGRGYHYAYAVEPGYTTTKTHVKVETRIYSVAEQRLLWTGITDTLNPSDLRRAVADIAAKRAELEQCERTLARARAEVQELREGLAKLEGKPITSPPAAAAPESYQRMIDTGDEVSTAPARAQEPTVPAPARTADVDTTTAPGGMIIEAVADDDDDDECPF